MKETSVLCNDIVLNEVENLSEPGFKHTNKTSLSWPLTLTHSKFAACCTEVTGCTLLAQAINSISHNLQRYITSLLMYLLLYFLIVIYLAWLFFQQMSFVLSCENQNEFLWAFWNNAPNVSCIVFIRKWQHVQMLMTNCVLWNTEQIR